MDGVFQPYVAFMLSVVLVVGEFTITEEYGALPLEIMGVLESMV